MPMKHTGAIGVGVRENLYGPESPDSDHPPQKKKSDCSLSEKKFHETKRRPPSLSISGSGMFPLLFGSSSQNPLSAIGRCNQSWKQLQ